MLNLSVDARHKLKANLMAGEGYRQFLYIDSRGLPTVGIGRCLSTNGISLDEALFLLDNDISRCEKELWHYAPWYADLDDARKCVILDMTFQLGIEAVLNFKAMIACINAKSWKGAAQAMLDSAWDSETPKRCHDLALAMETGSL